MTYLFLNEIIIKTSKDQEYLHISYFVLKRDNFKA